MESPAALVNIGKNDCVSLVLPIASIEVIIPKEAGADFFSD